MLTVVAEADTVQFQAWHAVVPIDALLAGLLTGAGSFSLPGRVIVAARPLLNCRDSATEPSIATSPPFVVDLPPPSP